MYGSVIKKGTEGAAGVNKNRPRDLVAFAARCTALPVFRMQEVLGSDTTLNWSGDSPDEFLSLALKAGAKLLYLQTMGESLEHDDEPEEAVLAFSCDKLFHAMRVRAPWAPPEDAAEDDEGEHPGDGDGSERMNVKDKELASRLKKNEEVILKDFFEFFARAGGAPTFYSAMTELQRFLCDTYEFPEEGWEFPKYRRELERLGKRLDKEFADREKPQIDALAVECIAWAAARGVKTLNQSDTELFLRETGRRLSHESMRLVWQKAKFELKARK